MKKKILIVLVLLNIFLSNGLVIGQTSTETLNNIVVFVNFADVPYQFTAQEMQSIEFLYNDHTQGAPSLYNYFKEVSYGKLLVESHFFIYNHYQTKAQFDDSPLYQGRYTNILLEAFYSLKSEVEAANLGLDFNNDNYIDNVSFIVFSYPFAQGVAWRSNYWWGEPDKNVAGFDHYSSNVISMNSLNRFESLSLDLICHEFFHTIGPNDMYCSGGDCTNHYSFTNWDLMTYVGNNPSSMNAYQKWRYGRKNSYMEKKNGWTNASWWITDIPEITEPGNYTLNPLTSETQNCYKIVGHIPSDNEYIMMEYRKRSGYVESNLPSDGLIVYKIDKRADGEANNTPLEYKETYLYGPYLNNTFVPKGNYSNLSAEVDVNQLNSESFVQTVNGEELAFPALNLLDGTYSNVFISNVGSAGNTISFDVGFCEGRELTVSGVSGVDFQRLNRASVRVQTSGTTEIASGTDVIFEASEEIILNPGFEVKIGGTFEAKQGNCMSK